MADGHAFQCFCSAETLQERRKEQQAKKHKIGYDGSCHMMDHTEIEKLLDSGTPYVVRMRLPKDSEVTFTDLVRGDITFNYNDLDDFVLLKSDGFPTYHLANVVDDHLMGITHVIRGEEWISSTPKHIALYEALGWEPAQFAHIPLLLNDDKSKLSKRHGSVSVIDFKEKGYLPEALINFIALLGWNPSAEQEIYSFDELTESFDLSKVNKSGAVFNRDKLDWLNRHYIQQKTDDELVELLGLKDLDKTTLKKILAIEKERMNKLSDFGQETKFFFDGVKHDKKMLTWKKSTAEKTAEVLEKLCTYLEKHGDWSINGLESGIKKWIADQGLGNGDVLWPMRVALSGSEKSPDPFTLADLYGKEKTISLIKEAHEVLKI